MQVSIREGSVKDVAALQKLIPEFSKKHSEISISERLKDRISLILIASVNGTDVAFKVGYQVSDNEFYSWIGAVLPQYRKLGVAQALLSQQEAWVKKHVGLCYIRVKSMNQFPAMMSLLINNGYQIHGYEDNGNITSSKVLFIKQLQ